MDEDKLDPGLKNAILSYFEGWELVEFLDIPIEAVVTMLEDIGCDEWDEVADYIDYKEDNDDDD